MTNWTSHETTTNHAVRLYNQTCPFLQTDQLNGMCFDTSAWPAVQIPCPTNSSGRRLTHQYMKEKPAATDLSLSTTVYPDGIVLTNALVHSLFEFSSYISNDIVGEWLSSTELKLLFKTIDSTKIDYKLTGVGRVRNPTRIGKFTIAMKEQVAFPTLNLNSVNETASNLDANNNTITNTIYTVGEYYRIQPNIAFKQKCTVGGTWGEQKRVVITAIRASDMNDPPIEGFSVNDCISLQFDVPTNMPPSATKEEIDAWLIFGGFINK